MISQRSILLVPFPFSDQSGKKVRPVLVLSNDGYNKSSEDLLVCAITSNLKTSRYSVIIDQNSLESGLLHQKSRIRVDSILKISKNMIIKDIGILNRAVFQKVTSILKDI